MKQTRITAEFLRPTAASRDWMRSWNRQLKIKIESHVSRSEESWVALKVNRSPYHISHADRSPTRAPDFWTGASCRFRNCLTALSRPGSLVLGVDFSSHCCSSCTSNRLIWRCEGGRESSRMNNRSSLWGASCRNWQRSFIRSELWIQSCKDKMKSLRKSPEIW